MKKRNLFALAAMGLFTFGCSEAPTSTEADLDAPAFRGGNGVMHHVSVGSNDACEAFGLEPGCDANYSLAATMKADGSVKGQWQDGFAGGGNGIHVAISCLSVDGNQAWVGGTITKGGNNGVDYSGRSVITRVSDNGKSANDAVDEIGFSIISGTLDGAPLDCATQPTLRDNPRYGNPNYPGAPQYLPIDLLPLTRGQVTVK